MNNDALNTINSILQDWANKFGTTVEKLIPEMQKYYIVQYVVTVVAWLVIIVIMLVLGRWLIKKHNALEEDGRDYDDLHFWGYGIWGFSIIPFSVLCYFTTTLFQWIVSPSAALIDKIMQIMSGR